MGSVDAVQVYAPNYFRWMDEGIHEWLTVLGHPLRELLAEGVGMPGAHARCDYLSPIGLDDVLVCETFASRVGTTSFDLTHVFTCEGREVARGRLTHVWMDLREGQQRKLPVPDWVRAAAAGGATADSPEQSLGATGRVAGVEHGTCDGCGRLSFPLEARCSGCGAAVTPGRSGDSATLTSWTTIRQAPAGFEAPYVLGWAELDNPALRLMGRVEIGVDVVGELRRGLPLRVFELPDDRHGSTSTVLLEVSR